MSSGEIFLKFFTLLVTFIFANKGINEEIGGKGAIGGYVNYLCPMDSNETFIPCDSDCRGQHAAEYGRCGDWKHGDYNCYCGPSTAKPNPKPIVCLEDTEMHRQVCEIDCNCNHAAKGGLCDFEKKACVCQHIGKNRRNVGCPYKTYMEVNEFFLKNLNVQGVDQLIPTS